MHLPVKTNVTCGQKLFEKLAEMFEKKS